MRPIIIIILSFLLTFQSNGQIKSVIKSVVKTTKKASIPKKKVKKRKPIVNKESRGRETYSGKNKNRTGGQSKKGGVGKNEKHITPDKKAKGKKAVVHSIKPKGPRKIRR